jgi:hypothetical protein
MCCEREAEGSRALPRSEPDTCAPHLLTIREDARILHPTPYTLHSSPYILKFAPYTLHVTPCPLHLKPYTLSLTHSSWLWFEQEKEARALSMRHLPLRGGLAFSPFDLKVVDGQSIR